jgi:hypothetical protein
VVRVRIASTSEVVPGVQVSTLVRKAEVGVSAALVSTGAVFLMVTLDWRTAPRLVPSKGVTVQVTTSPLLHRALDSVLVVTLGLKPFTSHA